MTRSRVFVVSLLLVVSTAACGGRVSPEQVAAEAAADTRGAVGGNPSLGAGSTASELSIGGAEAGSASGGAAGTSGAADRGGDGSAPATEGDQAATLPPGGNGGATDIGVTGDTIVLGNVSTLSGPVPGLFRGALVGAQAWAAMINSQGGINGRRIEVRSGDDGLDTGRNRSATLGLRDKVFGFLGSFSVTDAGGASVLDGTNVPDIGFPITRERYELATNYSAVPARPGWESGPARWYAARYGPKVVGNTAFLVSAVPSTRALAARERAVLEQNGYRITYTREVQPNEPNYTGDIVQMRQTGVQAVMWEAEVAQLADLVNDMHFQGFRPALLNPGSTAYSDAFLELTGDASEGAMIDLATALYLGEDAAAVPEVALFTEWLATVDPNQAVDIFAVLAWANGRLLEQALRSVGPTVTRQGVLDAIAGIHDFDAGGLIAPADPGGRNPTSCFVIVTVHDGRFVREHPASGFDCTTGPFVPIDD